jgi:hypothetical protein
MKQDKPKPTKAKAVRKKPNVLYEGFAWIEQGGSIWFAGPNTDEVRMKARRLPGERVARVLVTEITPEREP